MKVWVCIPIIVPDEQISEHNDADVPAIAEAKRLLSQSRNPCAYDIPNLEIRYGHVLQ